MLSAPAQRPALGGGQPILFSSPANVSVATNTPSLVPKPPDSLNLIDLAEAPAPLNLNNRPQAPLPSVIPMLSAAEAARERDLLDRRRNWALLTPAEILGAATPESVMGITEHDSFGQPKSLTVMERYAERQNRAQLLARSNSLSNNDAIPPWPSSGDTWSAWNSQYGSYPSAAPNSPFGRFFNPASSKQSSSSQSDNGGWSKLFNPTPALTPQLPAPDPEQVEDMERFRQLLYSGSPSSMPAAAPVAGGIKTSLPQALLGVNQSPANRLGGSIAPLTTGIGKPAELPKLPAAWLSLTSAPPAATWSPQSAPWLSPVSQPLAAPQRKF